MRDHIKAFLLASSLAFGIPTFVELTEAQRDQIFRIFHDQAAATREQMKLVRNAREALRVAALMRAQTMSRVAALLMPEQREKLRGLRAL